MPDKPVSLSDQIAAGRLGGYTGEDIHAALGMARDDVSAVEHDLTALGKETGHRGLQGKDREEFFKGMTQEEFDLLHKMAMHLGDPGMNKLEKMMAEAKDVWHRQPVDGGA